jgi:hypothetical protein
MTRSRRYSTTLTALAFVVLAAPVTALAQRDFHRQGIHENRGYTSTYALNAAVRRLAYQSSAFQRSLESELNRSYLDGTAGEKRANQLSSSFSKAAETLNSLYAVGRTLDNSGKEAGTLFQLGDELDGLVLRAPVSRVTLESWDSIRCELSSLTSAYDLAGTTQEDPGTEGDVLTQDRDYHSAALSYGRIWSWLF